MRIISGIAGGIRLEAPADNAVRPTTDRVKESMFSVLGDLSGKRVVDLFAGSGALGLEALSRGAALVVFVESKTRHLRLIERNLATVRKAMGAAFSEAYVIAGDALKFPRLAGMPQGPYDVIIADPPYRAAPGAGDLLACREFAACAGEAIVVIEHDTSYPLATGPQTPWRMLKRSRFGTTTVTYIKAEKTEGRA